MMKLKCSECDGKGEYIEFSEPGIGTLWNECHRCGGKGYYSLWNAFTEWYWQHLPVRIFEWWVDVKYRKEK